MPGGPPGTHSPTQRDSAETFPESLAAPQPERMDESVYITGSLRGLSPVPGDGNTEDHFGGGVAATRGWGPFSEPGSPEGSPGRARTRGSLPVGGGGGGAGVVSIPKVCEMLFVENMNVRCYYYISLCMWLVSNGCVTVTGCHDTIGGAQCPLAVLPHSACDNDVKVNRSFAPATHLCPPPYP